jgi:SAM-dependent methyltransferase
MHNSVLKYIKRTIKPEQIKGKRILEVGSLNINGSPRSIILKHQPECYRGIDLQKGEGVDIVLDAKDLPMCYDDFFDVVICLEMLEHAHDWQSAVHGMKIALKHDGMIILTTRSPDYPKHNEPDYWRFTMEDMAVVFSDFIGVSVEPDPQVSGVFVCAWKPLDWVENDLNDYGVQSV